MCGWTCSFWANLTRFSYKGAAYIHGYSIRTESTIAGSAGGGVKPGWNPAQVVLWQYPTVTRVRGLLSIELR